MPRFSIFTAANTLALLVLLLTAPNLLAQQNNQIPVIPAALPSGIDDKVGDASEINKTVTGTLASLHRNLATGDDVFSNELITTSSNADAKFQLLDQTTLAIGPNASIILDRFVYDRKNGATDVSINAIKGSFRFLSGTTPDTGYKIATPTGTVGIRGTEFEIFIDDNGETAVALISGEVEMCSLQRSCERLKEAGHYLRVLRTGRFIRAKRANRSILGSRANAARAFPFLHGKRKLGKVFKLRRARIKARRGGATKRRARNLRRNKRQTSRTRAFRQRAQVRRNATQQRRKTRGRLRRRN